MAGTYVLILIAILAGCSSHSPKNNFTDVMQIEQAHTLTPDQLKAAGLYVQCMLPIVNKTDAIYFPSIEKKGDEYATVYEDIEHEKGFGNYVFTYMGYCNSEWDAYVEELTASMPATEAKSFKESKVKRKQLAIYALIRERRAKISAQAPAK